MTQPRPRVPPYRQIAAEIRSQIERGELDPGVAMPSIVKLAEQYHVATGTVQKAIRLLMAEGLVESEPGYGTFVAEPKD